MANEIVPIEIILMLQRYSKDMRQATKDASALDTALASLLRQAKKTGAALDQLGGKIAIDLDTSALARAESQVRGFPDVDVMLEVDTSRGVAAIHEIASSAKAVEIPVEVNEEKVQTELNSLTTPRLEVDVQANEEQVQSDLNSLSAPNLKVDVKADTSSVEKQLDDLKKLARIDLAFEIGGGLLGAAQNVESLPIIGGVNDLQMALNELQANTGKVIPDAEKLINDVFSAGNWGATRDEVAGVIGELSKFDDLSDDLGGNAVTAFQVMQTTGTDLETTIDSLRTIVSSGLVPDVQSAGDLIVTTFQRGGNVAGDAIETITEYSSHFAEAGVTGAAAMDLIIQGLQAGTRDGDKLADTFKEMNLKVKEALGGVAIGVDTGSAIEPLRRLGLLDEAQAMEAGEITGTAFIDAVIRAAEEKGTDQDIFDILGTPAEDFGVDILKGLDFAAADVQIIPEGAAEKAATLLNDNLGSAIQNLGRVVETELLAKIELGGMNIQALLDGATDKVYELASLISSGVEIPEALEIALDVPGLTDTIKSLESSMGNFIIELLGGLANILEGIGQGEAAENVRGEVARLGEQQLAFDIQLNPDNLSNITHAFEVASSRGVSVGTQSDMASQAVAEMLEKGNIAGAQALVDTLSNQPPMIVKALFDQKSIVGDIAQEIAIPLTIDPDATQEELKAAADAAIAKFQTENPDFIAYGIGQELKFEQALTVDTADAEKQLTDYRATVDDALANIPEFFGGILEEGRMKQQALDAIDAAAAVDDFAEAVRLAQEAGLEEEADYWQQFVDDAGLMDKNLQAIEDGHKGVVEQTNAAILGLQQLGEATNSPLIINFAQKLAEHQSGLDLANKAALNTAKEGLPELGTGIDKVTEKTDLLTTSTADYITGLQGGLEIAKVSWDDYKTFLDDLTLPQPLNGDGGTTPPIKLNAAGGITAPGLNIVGERGAELISSDTALAVLNNTNTNALIQGVQMALSGIGGGSRNTTINLNIINNNNNAAAGIASSDRLNASLRGFR